jgi:hypothetical protein
VTHVVVRSAPVLDELVGDDGAVVLMVHETSHRVVRLSVLGQTIRELAADGISSRVLERALVERLGTPDTADVQALVKAAVDDLAAEGLVTVDGQ